MIKYIKISNYKTIKNEIVIEFNDSHPMTVLFGRIQSGKSVIFESIYMLKEAFLYGMRAVGRLQGTFDANFELGMEIDGQKFVYQTTLNLDKNEISYESLKVITSSAIHMYFIRNQYEITLGEKLEKLFTPFDFERFQTYLYDLRFDKREFLLTHLRIKDFSDSKGALILNRIVEVIENIHIFNKDEDINFYQDMDDAHYLSVLKTVSIIYPNILMLQYKKVTLDELRFNLNRHRYDHLLDAFRNHVTKFDTSNFFVECYNQFYKLRGRSLDELTIQSIDVHFKDGSIISFEKLSKGLRKLLLLSMILLKHQTNDLVLIDDLTTDLDHETAKALILKVEPTLNLYHRKLLFSTHDMLLFDQEMFDLKDMIYVHHKDMVHLENLGKLGIRKDKKLLNLYLDGFFNKL